MAYKKTSRNHWLSGDGNTLYSYGCEVCHVENGKYLLGSAWNYSRTTLRHVSDFLRWKGLYAGGGSGKILAGAENAQNPVIVHRGGHYTV